MFTVIEKRDGRLVPFDKRRIADAIFRAAQSVGGRDRQLAMDLADKVVSYLLSKNGPGCIPSVEQVQDVVEKVLIEEGHAQTAKAYILYRAKRTRIREGKSELMDIVSDILKETSRENANVGNSPSAKMLQIASAASRQYYLNRVIPDDISRAHRDGDIHIHDLDYYGKTLTCLQIPLGELLENGFNAGHGYVRPPRRPGSAAALAAIILQSCQNDMHGGQSFAHFDKDMAPYVRGREHAEVYQAMEGLIYNLNSMHSRAGAQVPFSSINLGSDTSPEGRLVTRCLLEAYERGLGRGETPLFPNVIFRVKAGVNFHEGDPNYDLFRLACRVAARRMNPTFSFMDSSFNDQYSDEVAYMGCRTRVIANRHGDECSSGRGNLSFTSINLPRLALEADGDEDRFMARLESRLELCARQLHHRYEIQSRLRVRDMPFLMGQHLYMDSKNLSEDDEIGPAIKHGTLSIGFIGLAETLKVLRGKHHGEDEEADKLGYSIVGFMRTQVDRFAEEYDLNYTLLATPAEGLSGRFVSIDRERFGPVKGVTDRPYYTNSFHLPVSFPTSIWQKLSREGKYHTLTNAGHISYVELPSPPLYNVEAVERIVRAMAASDMGYGGINFPIDECVSCGFSGIVPSACPSCGSTRISRIRRITGYLSTIDRFNEAKVAELSDRSGHQWGAVLE
ncbi:MAG: anaerobic ribonucleoside-triphosphate reductase [Firmicutes bacterium]|jgi:ribonucleoside-triphosphate reductase|nr:anaerobic ribonucleoside-triphosphate reductase [Bacillota bacterium]